MLQITTPCDRCDTKGRANQGIVRQPLGPDGGFDLSVFGDERGQWLDVEQDGEVVTCWTCKGIAVNGVTYARYRDRFTPYGDAYKSVTTLKAAITKGKATVCKDCKGQGKEWHLPVLRTCYSCSGAGHRPTWNADVDPVLPLHVSHCDNATKEFITGWLATAQIVVAREDRGVTWGEYHLGTGGLFSLTDYGTAWNSSDEEVIEAVKANIIDSPPQFINMLDRETRRFGNTLVIALHRQGYTPRVADVPQRRPALPPTYTDELLNRPLA
jgi:hypothetical protein